MVHPHPYPQIKDPRAKGTLASLGFHLVSGVRSPFVLIQVADAHPPTPNTLGGRLLPRHPRGPRADRAKVLRRAHKAADGGLVRLLTRGGKDRDGMPSRVVREWLYAQCNTPA